MPPRQQRRSEIILYFDSETCFVPIAETRPPTGISYTVAIENQEHRGYIIAVLEHGKTTHMYFKLKRVDNCLAEAVKSLNVLARDIYNQKLTLY